jgi:hypothetical protein
MERPRTQYVSKAKSMPSLNQSVEQNFPYTVSLISTVQILNVIKYSIKKQHTTQPLW